MKPYLHKTAALPILLLVIPGIFHGEAFAKPTEYLGENSPTTELHLNVLPYVYDRWFMLLVLVALAVCVWLIYKWRERDLARQRNFLMAAVEDRVKEITEQKELIERNAEDLKRQNEELRLQIENILERSDIQKKEIGESIDVKALSPEEDTADKKFIEQVMEVVRTNYQNSYFDVGDFAEAMGMSRSLLNRKLTSMVGESPNQFIRAYRLKTAYALLTKNRTTKMMNVSEIAFEVGFNDSKYFTRCFTKEYGKSPSTMLRGD